MKPPRSSPTSAEGPQTHRGVMDAGYAQGRVTRPHLAFRLQSRALYAARAYQRFAKSAAAPRVLDLGAAEGRTMVEVHRVLGASESIGIEYAQDLVAAASDLPRGCRLVQGDVTAAHPEAAAASFDLVTALAVLEHVDDLGAVGREVLRALRPGGIFVASCPAPTWDRVSGSLGLHKDEHHTVAMDRKGFTDFARAAGLEPLLYQPFMFAPVGFLPYAGIKVSAAFAASIDALLRPIPLSGLLMVNQLFVARKPEVA